MFPQISEKYKNLSKENAAKFLVLAVSRLQDIIDDTYDLVDNINGQINGKLVTIDIHENLNDIGCNIDDCHEYLKRIDQLCAVLYEEEK